VDFLDFEGQELYFDAPLSAEVAALLEQAANAYPGEESEAFLMRGYFLEPEHLTVLVALYRFYYYRHRYHDALVVSERALKAAGRMLDFRVDWPDLRLAEVGRGVMVSMGLTRFYLLALKASGYLQLRVGAFEEAAQRLDKLAELDPNDQFSSGFLREMAHLSLKGPAGEEAAENEANVACASH
jgi:tetratricopeptide (TPR) repeat protein